MPGKTEIRLTPSLKREIIKLIDARIAEAHVTKEDFTELKNIVKELSLSQKELAEAQKRTEQRVEELAEAQKRTEQRVEELAEALEKTSEEVRKLAIGLNDTRQQLGGLARSFSYAFENEAYRHLPKVLYEKYGYNVTTKVVRAEIGGKEINFFGSALKNGVEVYIVGESKMRLDDSIWRAGIFEELEEKVNAVKKEYGNINILKLLVAHFATNSFIEEARKRDIIVIQSFEW
ncbi:MAG: hypothetical protein N2316_03590 [Spirochaetes bacterium]|nr:hypothetical protein [Spirochaetota bacterium]